MEDSHAELDAFEIAKRRLAAVAVRMKFDRDFAGAFQHDRDQSARALRCQQTADVFKADAPGLCRGRFFRFSGIVVVGVPR